MPHGTKQHKTIKISLPEVSEPLVSSVKLPFGGEVRTSDQLVFSFACFDRSHKLFNLGGEDAQHGMVSPNWFVDLLDCLKNVSRKKIHELKGSVHDLHPVDWGNANASIPPGAEQCEFWQFRINKSKGRIVGILIDGIFYIVWLDPHHNLSDSDGYRGAAYYFPAKSEYELRAEELQEKDALIKKLEEDLRVAEILMAECSMGDSKIQQ